MFFKKKEDKGKLPDLPPLPIQQTSTKGINFKDDLKLEENDSMDIEKHSLPSFPDSLEERGFSQSMIKNAVSDEHDRHEDHDDLPRLPEDSDSMSEVGSSNSTKIKVVEAEQSGFDKMESSKWYSSDNISEPKDEVKPFPAPKMESTMMSSGRKDRSQDIFVRLDKYKNARKSLDEMEYRLNEIEDLLKRIRETKLREEQELGAWDQELMTVKNKLKEVTSNIFEKVE